MDAFYKKLVQSKYRGAEADKSLLPDYLLIVDDDTYVNLPAVTKQLQKDYNHSWTNQRANAVAGCMIRSRLYEHNFTHTFGGFGLFLNRLALENFMRPLHCPTPIMITVGSNNQTEPPSNDFEQQACWRLAQNSIGETALFRTGMSVADLMYAYASHSPYLDYQRWNSAGYCLHSDWGWGYFINFYFIASHTTDNAAFANVPQERLRPYRGSVIYAGRQTKAVLAQYRECQHKADACTSESHLCHYVTPEQMRGLYKSAPVAS